MVGFVLSGMDGWRRVKSGKLQVDGVAMTTRKGDLFVTSPLQEHLMASGSSMYPPRLPHYMNDLALVYLVSPTGFDEVASDCFIRLGQGEARAIGAVKNGDPNALSLMAQQRICEAALAFNLLAVGGKWRSAGSRLTWRYWKIDWVSRCDGAIQELKKTAKHLEKHAANLEDHVLVTSMQIGIRDLKTIRAAFAEGV